MKHFVYIPFTGVGLNGGYRSDGWFAERIRVFGKFTLPSLKNQTNKDFTLWLSFRPEEKSNPLTQRIITMLNDSGLRYVCTYHGLMYWDDKFPIDLKGKLRTLYNHVRWAYRKNRWETVVPMFREVWWSKNHTLKQRLRLSVYKISADIIADIDFEKIGMLTNSTIVDISIHEKADTVLLTRIDSDDCFSNDAIKHFRGLDGSGDGADAVVCRLGYIYSEETGQLCTWEPRTNPPFHTIVFRNGSFWDIDRHFSYYEGRYRSHEDVTRMFHHTVIANGSYCVTVHGKNNHISTTWNHPFRGEEITGEEKQRVLASFSI